MREHSSCLGEGGSVPIPQGNITGPNSSEQFLYNVISFLLDRNFRGTWRKWISEIFFGHISGSGNNMEAALILFVDNHCWNQDSGGVILLVLLKFQNLISITMVLFFYKLVKLGGGRHEVMAFLSFFLWPAR